MAEGTKGAPAVRRLEPLSPLDGSLALVAYISRRGAVPLEDDVRDAAAEVLARHPQALPRELKGMAVARELENLAGPGGLERFVRLYASVRIKGGDERGWQPMFPGGTPRKEPNGRSWSWQALMAELVERNDMLVVLKARQIGWTFLVANAVLWQMMFRPGSVCIVITNKMPNARRVMRRVRDAYRRLPDWLQESVPAVSLGIDRIELENGSSLEPMSSASDTGRSEAATMVVLDEFSHIRPLDRQEDVWASVEACADGGGKVLMLSTANGIGDIFYSFCHEGMSGEVVEVLDLGWPGGETLEVQRIDDGAEFVFLPYWADPARDHEWMERKRKRYRQSLSKLQQEYPETPAQAFIASGSPFFSVVHVEETAEKLRHVCDERDVRVSLVWKDKDKGVVSFVEDPFGDVIVHGVEDLVRFIQEGREFVIGADCAGEAASGGDAHAASVVAVGRPYLDETEEELAPQHLFTPHVQVMTIHGRMQTDQYAAVLEKAGYLCNRALIAAEANGVGAAVISDLRRFRYPRLYRRVADAGRKRAIGWWTDEKTKARALGALDRDLRNGAIEIRDIDTIDEMRNVCYTGSGRVEAPDPKHDDRVMGLAIARAVLRPAFLKLLAAVPEEGDEIRRELELIAAEWRARTDAAIMLGREMLPSYGGRW